MKDLLFFDKMVTPKIITFVYWLMLLIIAFIGFKIIFGEFFGRHYGPSFESFSIGLIFIVFGAVAARILSEILVVMFKINEALQEIRKK
ncbi:MAG: DUF4282 domain-containing protein [Alcanivoracaceae bacterium]|nr:DUF4282 domain-containing protein [Alcanivoracaceae bacterium]